MEEKKFGLDIRRKIFSVGVVTHWNRLSRDVVDGPVKPRLDKDLSNLLKWKLSLPVGGEIW